MHARSSWSLAFIFSVTDWQNPHRYYCLARISVVKENVMKLWNENQNMFSYTCVRMHQKHVLLSWRGITVNSDSSSAEKYMLLRHFVADGTTRTKTNHVYILLFCLYTNKKTKCHRIFSPVSLTNYETQNTRSNESKMTKLNFRQNYNSLSKAVYFYIFCNLFLTTSTLQDPNFTIIVLAEGRCPTTQWWRHQMETFTALLAICAGNSPVPGEFPAQRPVTRSFDVFFDLRLNKRLRKQSWSWWFETLSCPLWRHCNAAGIGSHKISIYSPSLRLPT